MLLQIKHPNGHVYTRRIANLPVAKKVLDEIVEKELSYDAVLDCVFKHEAEGTKTFPSNIGGIDNGERFTIIFTDGKPELL